MELIFTVKFWLIVGFGLAILEVFTGFFIALSFGVAAFAMAGLFLVWPTLLTEWYEVLFVFGLISLIFTSISWRLFNNTQGSKQDIND